MKANRERTPLLERAKRVQLSLERDGYSATAAIIRELCDELKRQYRERRKAATR